MGSINTRVLWYLVAATAAWSSQLGVMSLTVYIAGFIAVAQVNEQLLTSATLEAGRVPRGFRCPVRLRLGYDDRHPTGFYADSAASACLTSKHRREQSASFSSEHTEEAITHKSAKIHAGNGFVIRDLGFWHFDPKINDLSGLIINHFYVNLAVIAAAAFEISCEKTDNGGKNPTPTTAVGVVNETLTTMSC